MNLLCGVGSRYVTGGCILCGKCFYRGRIFVEGVVKFSEKGRIKGSFIERDLLCRGYSVFKDGGCEIVKWY